MLVREKEMGREEWMEGYIEKERGDASLQVESAMLLQGNGFGRDALFGLLFDMEWGHLCFGYE